MAKNIEVTDEMYKFLINLSNELNTQDNRCTAGSIGFRGVGYYPQWKMGTLKGGFHLDVRPDRTMDKPAEWGYVNGEFVSIDEALEWVSNG